MDNPEKQASFNAAAGLAAEEKFWGELQQAATLQQWQRLQRLLGENENRATPYNSRTSQVMQCAAEAGQLEIVAEMCGRGFRFSSAEEGSGAVLRVVKDGGDAALPVVGFLLKNNYASAEAAVLFVARDGTPETMQKLKEQGADITARGSSFSLAFYAGNTPMMRYLYNQGMTLYRPSVIAGLYGRRESFADRFSDVSAAEVAAAYRRLIAEDVQRLDLYCAYVCPDHPALDDLRAVPYGLKDQDMTLMHLLARTGQVEDIVNTAFKEDKHPLMVEDLLRQDRDGVSVLAILAARGEAQKLADARLWLHNPAAVAEVNEALKDLRAGLTLDGGAFESDLHYYRLKKKSDPARWSLKPKAAAKK